jgi:hypothetical protein
MPVTLGFPSISPAKALWDQQLRGYNSNTLYDSQLNIAEDRIFAIRGPGKDKQSALGIV